MDMFSVLLIVVLDSMFQPGLVTGASNTEPADHILIYMQYYSNCTRTIELITQV